jgi:magnesium-transporting ATPase (P-type)
MLVGLLPHPWYYTPLFKGPRSPVGLIVVLFSSQFLIMSVVTFPLAAHARRILVRGCLADSQSSKAHIAVVPLVIKAFLVSAVLQVPFILMEFSHSRTLEVLGTLFFVLSLLLLLERLPPTLHLLHPTRDSTSPSYMLEVVTLQFVMVGTFIFGIMVAERDWFERARLVKDLGDSQINESQSSSEETKHQGETRRVAAIRGRHLER